MRKPVFGVSDQLTVRKPVFGVSDQLTVRKPVFGVSDQLTVRKPVFGVSDQLTGQKPQRQVFSQSYSIRFPHLTKVYYLISKELLQQTINYLKTKLLSQFVYYLVKFPALLVLLIQITCTVIDTDGCD